ncbi:MAG: YbaN family protein [Bradymonadales bacterium]|nr:YbaN family protein [Bradymonadales bacterium]
MMRKRSLAVVQLTDRKREPLPDEGSRCMPGEVGRAGYGRLGRALLVAAGTLFVLLGLIGVVVPVLPTTPFLLLAGGCYLRSSRRLYRWLYTNRVFGEYLRRYRDGEGLPLATKIWTLLLLWVTLATSAFLVVPAGLWWVRLLLLAVGLGVTIHLARIRTCRKVDRPAQQPQGS